jgi:hypothetical protein
VGTLCSPVIPRQLVSFCAAISVTPPSTNMSEEMSTPTVDVALYGTIARYAGGRYIKRVQIELNQDGTLGDVYESLGIPAEERGYIFLNSVLADVPGMSVSVNEALHPGDHVGIFSTTHMWPYQYRDGIPMTETLTAALAEHGSMHHSYRDAGTSD